MSEESREAHTRDDLDTKIMRGSAWAALGFGGSQAISLLSMLLLARLLVPADFGVVAVALSILAIVQIAQESGMGAALIVHRGDMRAAAASVSVFAPIVAFGLYLIVFAVAPLAARFFDEPILTDVLRVMALVLILRGFTVMPISLIEREMAYRSMTAVELGAGIAQAASAVLAAAAGLGVWSLVIGQLAFAAGKLVLAWWLSPLRPSPFEARRETLRELVGFGRHVGVANLINYGNLNSQNIIIGRVLGATSLGYYSVSARLASMPVNVVGGIVGRAMFPALARVHGDGARFRQIWLETLQRLALLSTPTAIGVALVAEPLVVTLLGESWRPAIVPVQILALNGIVGPLSATAGEVFQALHRPKLRAVYEGVYLVISVPLLVLGASRYGVEGVAATVVLFNGAFGLVILAWMTRLLDAQVRDVAHAILRPALGWGMMMMAILALRPVVDDFRPGLALVTLVGVGGLVYVAGVALFARDLVTTMWLSLRGARTSA
jgi:PST family polysaccharide transporter